MHLCIDGLLHLCTFNVRGGAHPSPLMCDGCRRHQQSIITWLLDFVKSGETGANEVAVETDERRFTSPHERQGRRACARLSMDLDRTDREKIQVEGMSQKIRGTS